MIYLIANNMHEAQDWRRRNQLGPRDVLILTPSLDGVLHLRGRRFLDIDRVEDITRYDGLSDRDCDRLIEIWRELHIIGVPT